MNSVLLSIQPKWCELIASGKKTIEVRKTKPNRCISSIGASCLSLQELKKYSNGKDIYGWHISDLIIYDKPRELQEFYVEDTVSIKQCEYRVRAAQPASVTDYNGWIKGANICTKNVDTQWCENCITKPLTRPPMSWCYIASPGGECL